MRQRALIGMALACEPKILIADEPTTALDVTIQSQIVQLFHELREQLDLTLIYITHNLDLMAELCDRAIVMYQGKIVEEGDVKTLFNSPQHPYTRMLIDCVPRLNKPENNVISTSNKNGKPNLLTHNIELEQLNNKEPIIEFENVYRDFFIEKNIISSIFGSKKTLRAVADFNLKICKGDIIGIVGESGSGKSTVAMLALHLLSATSGNIYYRRKNISNLKGLELKSFRHNVQMVFQDNQSALNPRKTILKTLNEALIIRHGSPQNINQMAEDLLLSMGLDLDILERYPHSLSGGQRQRVGIARAMAMEPEIIVADEPVSSLDVSLQTQIIKLFLQLHKKHNLTLIFISHDLALVSHLCKRLIVMQDGKIVEAGNAFDIMMHPSHPYTQNLINSVPKGITKF
jgi:peptide/nickel transport system ATP-binding protein